MSDQAKQRDRRHAAALLSKYVRDLAASGEAVRRDRQPAVDTAGAVRTVDP